MIGKVKKHYKEYLPLSILLLFLFFLVYSPHIVHQYPLHSNEWHHIIEGQNLASGEYEWNVNSFRFGFHVFLAGLSFFVNLLAIYKFLPALWAVLSAITLYWIVYKKTKRKGIALFAVLFFASIKSNLNLLGLWFFTPLTFTIPLAYLFFYYYEEGILTENKNYLVVSCCIGIATMLIYPLASLFAIPALFLFSVIQYKKIIKNYKLLLPFLIIPITGILFFSFIFKYSLVDGIQAAIKQLAFRYGWGDLEIINSPLELYSFIGYILAVIGIIFYLKNKKYTSYILWIGTLVVSILYYHILGVSFLSPYQRNMYYLVLILPLFSALGLHYLLGKIKSKQLKSILLIVIILATFINYYRIPLGLQPVPFIDENDYEDLSFISELKAGTLAAPLGLAIASKAITKHEPIGAVFFYGDIKETNNFYDKDCTYKKESIQRNNIKYIISRSPLLCEWDNLEEIKNDHNYIYKITKEK